MEDSKVELVELAKNGNKNAFAELIQDLKIKMYKTAISILKNDEDACDAIQETLIKSYTNISKLQNNKYFSTWVIRILINQCYDIIRKRNKIVAIDEKLLANQNTYYEIYSKESQLEYVLSSIENDLKMVTVLYYYDDLSVKEISDTLNIPEGTVKSRLSRAREKIYTILKEEEGENNG